MGRSTEVFLQNTELTGVPGRQSSPPLKNVSGYPDFATNIEHNTPNKPVFYKIFPYFRGVLDGAESAGIGPLSLGISLKTQLRNLFVVGV